MIWLVSARYSGDQETRLERNTIAGEMPGKTQAASPGEAQRAVAENEIVFSINTNPVFSGSPKRGNVMFENPLENQKRTRVEICRDDNGDVIYESGTLLPGNYIGQAELDMELTPGEYPCTAFVYGYGQKDRQYIGKVSARIVVTVQ